ncbi:MAG: hypothetical protein K8S97_06840 [Anaerolineae bacterium]|nr:hypothetical protein [Anaerolineae bacterium]
MNLLMSRLDEQQRRWYAAVESEKIGHGGDVQVSRITGLNVETIRRPPIFLFWLTAAAATGIGPGAGNNNWVWLF